MNFKGTECQIVKEALSGPNAHEWQKAMDAEYQALLKNKTWTLTQLPPGCKTVGCKWVSRIKYKTNGEIDHYKARLVAKVNSQIKGVDYHDIISPVIKITTLHLLCARAAILCAREVIIAFLSDNLIEIIFMDQPEGYVI